METMLYAPSPVEMQRFDELVARLTLSDSVYAEYRAHVDRYLDKLDTQPAAISYQGMVGCILRTRLTKSVLFDLDFLVAYVDTDWFRSAAPTCDAVSSAGFVASAEEPPPPVVLVPADRIHARSQRFRSVIEHEFVHVCQALLGLLPGSARGRAAGGAFESFFSIMRAEYQANLLQLTKWPALYPHDFGISLEHWCVLRGYSQALAQTLLAATADGLPPIEVSRFLDTLAIVLSDVIHQLDVDPGLTGWFVDRIPAHLVVALTNLLEASPGLAQSETLKAIARWLQARGNDGLDGLALEDFPDELMDFCRDYLEVRPGILEAPDELGHIKPG
ncbi:MAG: hypothetical protein V2A73_05490 [Pseudomonadota bacterium]